MAVRQGLELRTSSDLNASDSARSGREHRPVVSAICDFFSQSSRRTNGDAYCDRYRTLTPTGATGLSATRSGGFDRRRRHAIRRPKAQRRNGGPGLRPIQARFRARGRLNHRSGQNRRIGQSAEAETYILVGARQRWSAATERLGIQPRVPFRQVVLAPHIAWVGSGCLARPTKPPVQDSSTPIYPAGKGTTWVDRVVNGAVITRSNQKKKNSWTMSQQLATHPERAKFAPATLASARSADLTLEAGCRLDAQRTETITLENVSTDFLRTVHVTVSWDGGRKTPKIGSRSAAGRSYRGR